MIVSSENDFHPGMSGYLLYIILSTHINTLSRLRGCVRGNRNGSI